MLGDRQAGDPTALIHEIDRAIQSARDDGTLADLSRRYFGGFDLTVAPVEPQEDVAMKRRLAALVLGATITTMPAIALAQADELQVFPDVPMYRVDPARQVSPPRPRTPG